MTPGEIRSVIVPFVQVIKSDKSRIKTITPGEGRLLHDAISHAALLWLREHPADEGVWVTEEWLKDVGFQSGRFTSDLIRGPIVRGVSNDGDVYWLVRSYSIPPEIQPCTRGHVRRLCNALGVTLTEPTK